MRNHVAVCSCPGGYKGDPFSYCRRADPGKWNDLLETMILS